MSTLHLFLIIIFAVLFIWLVGNYIKLIYFNFITIKSFDKIDSFIKKYILTLEDSPINNTYIEWYNGSDDTNRKIALIKEMFKALKDHDIQIKIKEELEPLIHKYNKHAQALRIAVEVFPSSFYARLKDIKWTNIF